MIRRLLRTHLASLALTVVAVLLGGASAVPSARAATNVTVSIANFHYQPDAITIHAGDSVTWVNDQQRIPHTSTSDDGFWHSPALSHGRTFTQVFPVAGTFAYHCDLQTATKHMRATVTVLP